MTNIVSTSAIISTPKHIALPIIPENIPAELKTLIQWVCWRYEWVNNKWTKVPINPRTLGYAKSNDPATWSSFEAALTQFREQDNLDGIGIVPCEHDPYCYIDLDHCLDDDQRIITDAARDVVEMMNSRTEITPSGEGLRIIFKARTNRGRKFGNLEIYSQKHYLTITGQHLPGTPTTIEERQQQTDDFLETYFADDDEKAVVDHSNYVAQPLTNQRVRDAYERALMRPYGERFRELYKGNWKAFYTSQSRADLALVAYMAYEIGPDFDAIVEWFSKSGLNRDKWHRADYRKATINKALSTLTKWHVEIVERQDNVLCEGEKTEPTKPRGWTLTDLWNYKSKRKPLIPNLLISGTHTLFSAREKKGKTHWLTNFISDWITLGMVCEHSVEPIPMIYLDFEMGIDMFKGFYMDAFPTLDNPSFSSAESNFVYRSHDDGLLPQSLTIKFLEEVAAQWNRPGMIFIDTVRGAFSADPLAKDAGWENNASIIGHMLRPITSWCHLSGWNCVSVHHHNKQGSYSGSTEFGASVDATWDFHAYEESDARVLKVMGRGVSSTLHFDFTEGRYAYTSQAKKREVENWIAEKYGNEGMSLNALKQIHKQERDSNVIQFGVNKLQDVHKTMEIEKAIIRSGSYHNGTYTINQSIDLTPL